MKKQEVLINLEIFSTKTKRRVLCLALVSFLCALKLSAQDYDRLRWAEPSSASISVAAGIWNGYTKEIVYKSETSDEYISELYWDVSGVYNAGVLFELTPKIFTSSNSIFFISLGFQVAIPGPSGSMRDKDWSISQNPGWLISDSEHPNRFNLGLISDFYAGLNLPIIGSLSIKPCLSIEYKYFQFIASDGVQRYRQPGAENWLENYFHGEMDRYEQNYVTLSSSVRLNYIFSYYLGLELSLAAGAVLFFEATDHHVIRDVVFIDTLYFEKLKKGLELGCILKFTLMPFNKTSYNISADYKNIDSLRTDTTRKQNNTEFYSENRTGVYLFMFNVSLSVNIRL